MRVSIVVTTIGDGAFLRGYCDQAVREGLADDIEIIVIPDRKTPAALYQACGADLPVRVRCPSLDDQQRFLSRLGLEHLVPFDSDNRRNVGYLMALESGSEVLLSIDDDNYCEAGERSLREHLVVAADQSEETVVESDDGWFNVCALLDHDAGFEVFPRGFPVRQRHRPRQTGAQRRSVPVRLNAGLWLQDPDLDAFTWLTRPVSVAGLAGGSLVLDRSTWSPINTQNTALHRGLLPAWYFVRMGYPVMGAPIDRYGDILSGYFCEACLKDLGLFVRFGTPMARHARNRHDYLRDAALEMSGMVVLQDLVDWLREARLGGSACAESYLSLADQLEDQVERFHGWIWTDAVKAYFHSMAFCMRRWVRACKDLGG